MQVKDCQILIVGFARSGLAASNFLLARGAQVTISDIKEHHELEKSISQLVGPVRLSLGSHRLKDFLDADLIVLSPGIPSSLPELKQASEVGIPICNEIELAFQFLDGKVIGVTGSNGKTTTTTLIGELFKKAPGYCVVAGNIGSPLIDSVSRSSSEGSTPTTFVVELSSFQLENIQKFKCDTALLLNLSPDHLDRHKDFLDYSRIKERIFLNQGSTDHAILNADNPHTMKMAHGREAPVFLFSRKQCLSDGVFVNEEMIQISYRGIREKLLPIREIALRGNHNLENVLAATAAGFLSGLDRNDMIATFRTFRGVEHRLEPVRELNGVVYYNDSKATNVNSTEQALKSFSEPLILLMGGKDKGMDFTVLRSLVAQRVKKLVLIGTASERISEALGETVPTVQSRNLAEAVRLANETARPGDAVLLSPGCSSFDMFDDFEHRGRIFKQLVLSLKGQNADSQSKEAE